MTLKVIEPKRHHQYEEGQNHPTCIEGPDEDDDLGCQPSPQALSVPGANVAIAGLLLKV